MTKLDPRESRMLTVGGYMRQADAAILGSQVLITQIHLNGAHLFSPAAYLLHWGTELALKAYLFNVGLHEDEVRGHNLFTLYEKCCNRGLQCDDAVARDALMYINPYGAFDGGVRYLKRGSGGSVMPLDIFDRLSPLIESIRSSVDVGRDITLLHRAPR